ncbi:Man1-Src1p-C-terminal domain-containing protein [Epithele typhae]|uniref:Man1-Src1p-C-terminal domain-containing protein n=1 Tax=Epithele typhae TaxID=378194 RepID=UPI0020088394|nr:Man1-Src1p-C-terminal domain-containing protein [Epithele typhae]KAH9946183.1 Man1-Src1p-C-terminal domain-containing protein [Epithele typhae]
MSRGLTSTQVIELGDYLKPDFDPSTLTISQLRGVLSFHNISFPSSQAKAKLVQVFNEEERIKRENSGASDDGITDGVTGKPISKQGIMRRSSRLSKTPAPEEIPPPDAATTQSKRRRATAEPSLGGPSRRRPSSRHPQPTVVEESEPEDEPVVRKVGRPAKTTDVAGTHARRISGPLIDDPESGWEDNNVFQDSSPLRPSPVRPRARKSSASGRPAPKSRKSMSAPPDSLSSTMEKEGGKPRTRRSSVRPPESLFEPVLPAAITAPRQPSIVRDLPDEREESPFIHESPRSDVKYEDGHQDDAYPDDEMHGEPQEEVEEDEELDTPEAENVKAVARRIADGGPVVKAGTAQEVSRSGWKMGAMAFSSIAIFVVNLLALTATWEYKGESARIGFCDAAPTPTPSSRSLSSKLAPPSLLPPPDECIPCPAHGTCAPSSITCEPGYILHPHPLLGFLRVPTVLQETPQGALHKYERLIPSFTKEQLPNLPYAILSYIFDGMPYVGSVAFPPHCTEDPRRLRHIGVLGKSLNSLLAYERGRRVCEGVGIGKTPGDDATEARLWGFELERLKDDIKQKTAPQLLGTLDTTFNEAVQELLQTGRVSWKAEMSWPCKVKVQMRTAWYEWQATVIGTATAIAAAILFRGRQARRAIEADKVAELVDSALGLLRNQEFAHHTDPVTAPKPYLSSIQLRDLVLQDIRSLKERNRLWSKVERVVEANTNIRTNQEEVEGGDEQRVWQWVGAFGKTLPPATPGFGERIVA